MSLFTLSMTSSSFLFLQHQEYKIYDQKTGKTFRGIYGLYLFVNVPRVLANAVILSVTPTMALVLMFIEVLIFVFFCHKYSVPLNNNVVFPSGLVSALANYISVTGPFRKLGHINLFSNILLMAKVLLLYAIVYNDTLTVPISRDPDVFRCWNSSKVMNYTASPSSEMEIFNVTIETNTQGSINLSSRPYCNENESPNSLLFQTVLPIMLILIAFIAIPFGYIIAALMSKDKLSAFDLILECIKNRISNFCNPLLKLIKSFSECLKKCKTTSDDATKHNDNSAIALELLSDSKDENTDMMQMKSSSQDNNTNHHVEEKDRCIGVNTLTTFFDNVRDIFKDNGM